ncbi:hypothetical protein BC829DRAFT_156679 [Chytridium lagenaria]|nr:hypothetical protein BC829DRAFT_156679 [Chytridium lagenaria]
MSLIYRLLIVLLAHCCLVAAVPVINPLSRQGINIMKAAQKIVNSGRTGGPSSSSSGSRVIFRAITANNHESLKVDGLLHPTYRTGVTTGTFADPLLHVANNKKAVSVHFLHRRPRGGTQIRRQ